MPTPTLRWERSLLRHGASVVIGVDEVGRGAIAGPVTVAAVAITSRSRSAPSGVRDSKLLSAKARDTLRPQIEKWATGWAVGAADTAEIAALGLTTAMRLAGVRALTQLQKLEACAASTQDAVVLLDGSHDYLTHEQHGSPWRVLTRVRADLTCSSVAAASILAKTNRDAWMRAQASLHVGYGWETNMGYGTPEHLRAIAQRGYTPLHRYPQNRAGESQPR